MHPTEQYAKRETAAGIKAEGELDSESRQLDELEELQRETKAARTEAVAELKSKSRLLEEQSKRIDSLIKDRRKLRHAVDASERLVAYASERYRSSVRRRWLRSLRRRLWLTFRKLPVSRSAYRLVSDSVFFEKHFYLNDNPDVEASGIDPVIHYLKWGSREGRSPSPFFSESGYRDRYPDVGDSDLTAIEHYERYGRAEGRRLWSSNGRLDPASTAAGETYRGLDRRVRHA